MHTKGKVLLQFGASWCQPCKAIAPHAEQLAQVNGLTYVKKDIEQDHELANEFNIRSVPTIILLNDGKEIVRQQGGTPNTLRQMVENAL